MSPADTDPGIEAAARTIREGGLVVYPTETVYGLGADALNPAAVESVFEAKGRDRDKPLSLGVPSVDAALEFTTPNDRELRFMRAFLPGPVTVVVPKRDVVPDVLTGGREKVGVRVPDHEVALALFEAAETPVTATSANRSGESSSRTVDEVSPAIRERATVVDGGETPGTESTVVDVRENRVVREGAFAGAIVEWLEAE
ncbi:L-threonylcarbamoyladenylate synthase [Salinirubellus salinus]|jgi:L-threonylcarbamoyladenylate synthase|uniref:L-threonylcarbamoyladenylate synthase n=1 Tax=Salinirubellus salinus TaxID=1364945 RepID=A0A9E7R294_9EURY|nr:L-threonylcarbamoyladenylate synthase [Salinirubellus salinus]UWM54163.1 L-threonylcarbamoyladenylate synthase [Salinirubellus salinus]